ncbi:hypothetical protein ACHAO1_009983 [Botrytis cinerea]
MASPDYPPGFGDGGVQGDSGADWWEGNALDSGTAGTGLGDMNAGPDMGNGNNKGGNNNGNNGNGPPPRPQNASSPPSTTNPQANTCSYESEISTNTITTSIAAASSTSSTPPVPSTSSQPSQPSISSVPPSVPSTPSAPSTSSPPSTSSQPSTSSVPYTTPASSTSSQPSTSYVSSTSINTNTTSTIDTSSSSPSSFSTTAPTITITTTSSNSSALLAPATSIPSTSTTISSSTIAATPLSNTGAGTQPVGVTSVPLVASTQHGLSKGSIAGITIGSLALLALILTAIWYFLRRKKNNKQHRKSIGGFGVVEWNGGGNGGNMAQINESPSYNGNLTSGMGVQRISTWNTMRSLPGTHTRDSSSISQFPSAPSSLSPSTVQNPFSDQTHFSSFSFPFTHSQPPESPHQSSSNATTNEEGPHEDIVDFGDSIDWIRKRDRMRDRERSGLTGSNLGSSRMVEGKPDWRYSVRVNGGGNNL